MDGKHADFNFLAYRFGNLTAAVSVMETDNPQLKYRIIVEGEVSSINVIIGHHNIRLIIPERGSECCIEERFLDPTGTIWSKWDQVINKESFSGRVNRETDVIYCMVHEFAKRVWQGLLKNRPVDPEEEN